MINIGRYILDTLQIYFPWDDDLYTYFKNNGLGTKNTRKKALPLVYTDNCLSTTNVPSLRRKFVLQPKYFGRTSEELGWIATEREDELIIPAEQPQIEVSLIDNQLPLSKIKFRIISTVNDKEQYHIEYSAMSAFGKMYSNWAVFYIPLDVFRDLILKITHHIPYEPKPLEETPILIEKQQAQREELHYVELPVVFYKFSIGEFKYALEYLRYNGVMGNIPSLVYDSSNVQHKRIMSPMVKFGIVHTLTEQGFMARKPQVVMKIAQPTVSIGGRGKKVKTKGIIVDAPDYENYFIADTKSFLSRSLKLKDWFNSQPQFKAFSL